MQPGRGAPTSNPDQAASIKTDLPKVVRVITRLNVGGPAIHTVLLADRMRPKYQTILVSGVEAAREGNMLALASRLNVPVMRIAQLARDISPVNDFLAFAKLLALVRREKPQVLHTHTAKAGVLGRLAGWIWRVPVIVHTFHGHVFHGYFSPVATRFFLAVERLLALVTDQIVTVADQQREEIAQLGVAPASKITTIPLGLDLEEFEPGQVSGAVMRQKWGIPLDVPLVGIVARLVPVKGHELFLEAAAEIHKSRPDVHFVLVGDGELRGQLEASAVKHQIPVTFAGWETDVRAAYAALDVVCLSSFNEGLPVALIEALSAGRPVVSTAAGGVTDLIQHEVNGLLVRQRDAVAFARAIERLLDSPELAVSLGETGRSAVLEKYGADRLAKDVGCLYEMLLDRKQKKGAISVHRPQELSVLHVITRLIVGGAQENTLATAMYLQRHGIRCDLLTGAETGSEGDLFEEARVAGVRYRVTPHLVREVNPLKDLRALVELWRLMRRRRYTIVHTHSSKAGILGRIAAWLAGVPVVVHTVHGYAFNEYHSWIEHESYRLLEWLCGKLTDHIIVISRPLLARTVQNHIARENQLSVIHSGIDIQLYRKSRNRSSICQLLDLPEDAFVIGCVARLVEGKGHGDLLKAFAQVHEQRPDARLVLVGDGPLRADLERAAAELELHGAVRFLGLRRDVPDLLAGFDIFVLPSLWEGMGRVLLEAMASGCPVVATRVDGILDIVQDGGNGMLVEPRDPERMAAVILRLIENPMLRLELAGRGRDFVNERHAAVTMCAHILELYRKLLSEREDELACAA